MLLCCVAGEDSHGPVFVSYSVQHGSVLGPIEFIAYTEDVTGLIAAYASATILLPTTSSYTQQFDRPQVPASCQRLVSCISDLQQW